MHVFFVIAPLLLASASLTAHADTTPVGGSGGGVSGSGTLTAVSNGDGSYTITAVSGTGVTGLLQPGAFQGNDNLLYPGSNPTLDGQGFGFADTLGDTSYDVDLFYSSTLGQYAANVLDSDGGSEQVPVTFSLGSPSSNGVNGTERYAYTFAASTAITPEPASFTLLGTGLLGVVGVLKRRFA